MKNLFAFLIPLIIFSCNTHSHKDDKEGVLHENKDSIDFVLAFASCNDQNRPQPLWKSISENHPELFLLIGDNIYADTPDMTKMKSDYDKVLNNADFKNLSSSVPVMGTWDDHDFGKNDAGNDWEMRDEAQSLFWDFFQFSENDPLRQQKGVYQSKEIKTDKGTIQIILLDTRYFRDPLNKVEGDEGPYKAWPLDHKGTMLGEAQWKWLEETLKNTTADFTVIGSSIQLLSNEHHWERWGNFPSEMERLKNLIAQTNSNVIVVSGDRHMAEISVENIEGMNYPLVDFTSSGLTHTWLDGPTEGNSLRVTNVVKKLNFGIITFDFDTNEVIFQIRGEDNFIYDQYKQKYPLRD